MRHVKFTVETKEGAEGIIPNIFKNWASYFPTTGYAIGHDLIDHTTKETGEVWQEFRALGAHLFVCDFGKFDKGENSRYKSHIKRKAYDLSSDFTFTIDQGFEYLGKIDLPTPRKVKLTKGEEMKFKFFFHHLSFELQRMGEYSESAVNFWNENKDVLIGWMRVGFANAKRRYNGDANMAFYMKDVLKQLVERKMRELSNYADTGEEFTLSFDVSDGYATISHKYLM